VGGVTDNTVARATSTVASADGAGLAWPGGLVSTTATAWPALRSEGTWPPFSSRPTEAWLGPTTAPLARSAGVSRVPGRRATAARTRLRRCWARVGFSSPRPASPTLAPSGEGRLVWVAVMGLTSLPGGAEGFDLGDVHAGGRGRPGVDAEVGGGVGGAGHRGGDLVVDGGGDPVGAAGLATGWRP